VNFESRAVDVVSTAVLKELSVKLGLGYQAFLKLYPGGWMLRSEKLLECHAKEGRHMLEERIGHNGILSPWAPIEKQQGQSSDDESIINIRLNP
jgi:hypothetical protein